VDLVLTSHRYRERELIEELKGLGDFRRTAFKDVIRGEVEDLEVFLGELGKRHVFALSRVVPIEKCFELSPDHVVEKTQRSCEAPS